MSSALAPLWAIDDDLSSYLDTLDLTAEGSPERAEIEAKIEALMGAETEKVNRVDGVLVSLESIALAAKAEIDRLQQRRQAAERNAERLKTYLLRVIERNGGRPLKGSNVTFSTRHSEALVIDNLDEIPAEYKVQTISWDAPKMPIKRAIADGWEVPGVRLEQRAHLVRR